MALAGHSNVATTQRCIVGPAMPKGAVGLVYDPLGLIYTNAARRGDLQNKLTIDLYR
jgi:hypothetical protein